MRVLHLLDTDILAGTEQHVLTLATALGHLGVSAWVGCLSGGPMHRAAEEASLHVAPLGKKLGVPMWNRFLRVVYDGRFDLIHAHNGRTMAMAALARGLSGMPTVATQHFVEPKFATYRGVKGLLARWAHRRVNGRLLEFIAVSEAARSSMVQREHIPPPRITTIPCGLIRRTPSRRAAESLIRNELLIPVAAPMVVTVARLEKEKGLHHLISAAAQVIRHLGPVHFVLVGDGALRRQLEAQAETLGICGCVRFAGYRRDAIDIMAAADLVVLASLAESFGLVLLEAMSLGKAVVATRCGGPEEIVRHGETGLLVPPAYDAALAEALIELLGDAGRREEMGAQGLCRFSQHYTAERMAEATLAVYRRVTARPRLKAGDAKLAADSGIESTRARLCAKHNFESTEKKPLK